MVIYLDFDGTVVEHSYPKIGQLNVGCIEVIKKLQEKGHTVILNTMRSMFHNGSLEEALDFLKFHEISIEATKTKKDPGRWDWNAFRMNGYIIIDDQSREVPLKKAATIKQGWIVNWEQIDKELLENKIYDTSNIYIRNPVDYKQT